MNSLLGQSTSWGNKYNWSKLIATLESKSHGFSKKVIITITTPNQNISNALSASTTSKVGS